MRSAARRAGAPSGLHAFPSVQNAPSNALCHRLGFTLRGACDFEYPAGSGAVMRSNDWRLDLSDLSARSDRTPSSRGRGAARR